MLESFSIDDDLDGQLTGAIEVTLVLRNGARRWCFFMRPEALSACGDFVGNTSLRFHHGARHMIIVAGELNLQVIEQSLRQLEAQGELENCSLLLA